MSDKQGSYHELLGAFNKDVYGLFDPKSRESRQEEFDAQIEARGGKPEQQSLAKEGPTLALEALQAQLKEALGGQDGDLKEAEQALKKMVSRVAVGAELKKL